MSEKNKTEDVYAAKREAFLASLRVDGDTIKATNEVGRKAGQHNGKKAVKASDGGRERGDDGPGSLGREAGAHKGDSAGHTAGGGKGQGNGPSGGHNGAGGNGGHGGIGGGHGGSGGSGHGGHNGGGH